LKKYRGNRYRRYQMEKYTTRRQYRLYRKRRTRRLLVSTVTVVFVIAGLGLLGYSLLLGEDSLVPRAVESAKKGEELASSAPKDTTLRLTIPEMGHVQDLPVYDAAWDDESALDVSAAHLDSTGFPWQEGANVYIAGHRMGFPGTKSFLVFYDLDQLESGGEIFLTDSDGTKYTYKVFNKYVADPYDWSPTEAVSGKSIVTLQTCTLPDYTQRLIIQGELTKVEPGQEAEQTQEAKPAQEIESEQGGPAQEVESLPIEPVAPPESGQDEPVAVDPAQAG
jgi:sortase A